MCGEGRWTCANLDNSSTLCIVAFYCRTKGVVRGSLDAGGILLTPSTDGRSCHAVYVVRINLAGQLPSMVVQAVLGLQAMTVAAVTKVCVCLFGFFRGFRPISTAPMTNTRY